jgi:DNA-nicking Smr family endonuclease
MDDSLFTCSGGPMSGKKKVAAGKSLGQLADLVSKAGVCLKKDGRPSGEPGNKDKETRQTPQETAHVTDEEIFKSAMQGVQAASWRHDPHPASKPARTVTADPDLEDRGLMIEAMQGKFPVSIPDHPEYIEGWIGVAGKRFLPNLRNGIYSIQGQIDLHGFNRNEAETAVEEFIIRMSKIRSCCIKIIHGRGINSPTENATLKAGLQKLFTTRRMSRYVVAYASAPFRDGGVGAVYVLLTPPSR